MDADGVEVGVRGHGSVQPRVQAHYQGRKDSRETSWLHSHGPAVHRPPHLSAFSNFAKSCPVPYVCQLSWVSTGLHMLTPPQGQEVIL